MSKWNVAQGPEDLTDAELDCRVERHNFPRLRVGKPIPQAVERRILPDGWLEMVRECPDCGALLTTEERKGQVRYRRITYNPEKWNHLPRENKITKAEIRAERATRMYDDLVRGARRD